MRPQCFWDKIKQDLQLLCKATGRSTDESALIIHLVIKEIARSGQGIIIGHDGMILYWRKFEVKKN